MSDFDYIVVGSGAGGGPLAANLARAGFRVLLLEAGGDSCEESETGRFLYQVPIFHALSTEFPDCQWDYFVRHYSDEARQARDSKLVHEDPVGGAAVNGIWYPRAGTLGGCTAHNAMITVTPPDSDWDDIAGITGDPSWRADQMNSYFARLENCHYVPRPGTARYGLNGMAWSVLALARGRKDWRDWAHGHGFGGWLQTCEADPLLILDDDQMVRLVLRAVEFAFTSGVGDPLGHLLTKLDPNDVRLESDREGLALTPLAVDHGRRNGPREYLLETRQKYSTNLTIQLRSLVTRILFEGTRAIGVEFLQGKHLYEADPRRRDPKSSLPSFSRGEATASREVILCGGAFNSPQLLMLSGIGPRDHLASLGIDVRLDLPGVGENLQDRYEVGVVSEFEHSFTLVEGATFAPPQPGGNPDAVLESWKQAKGLYTSNGSVIGILKRSDPKRPCADLYIFGLPGFFAGYKPGFSAQLEQKRNRWTWAVLKAYTQNHAGQVRLRSADPTRWPEINFHYFDEGTADQQADLDAVAAGVEFVRKMNQALGSPTEIIPGPQYQNGSQLRDFIRNEAWGHHASCTNRMGRKDDEMAVLDSRFRVRGASNLRVVDASVFPKIPGYFIVSAVYMVSEKAADVITEDAQTKRAVATVG